MHGRREGAEQYQLIKGAGFHGEDCFIAVQRVGDIMQVDQPQDQREQCQTDQQQHFPAGSVWFLGNVRIVAGPRGDKRADYCGNPERNGLKHRHRRILRVETDMSRCERKESGPGQGRKEAVQPPRDSPRLLMLFSKVEETRVNVARNRHSVECRDEFRKPVRIGLFASNKGNRFHRRA